MPSFDFSLIPAVPWNGGAFDSMPKPAEVISHLTALPGAVARSEACPLGMQAAPSSIPTSGTFFHGDLVTKNGLRPFSLFR